MTDNKIPPEENGSSWEKLEALLRRVRTAASQAAEACGQFALQSDETPHRGPALPGRGSFQVMLRNDPQAETFSWRICGGSLELKTAAAILIAELAQGSDAAATGICREIEAAVVATNQQRRDRERDVYTGDLEEDFPGEAEPG
ncbi:MAG: hypothetical protein HDQ87_11640 [Clostridia bacterium]|nr:hypothetical protein [Clostridia bacterium]